MKKRIVVMLLAGGQGSRLGVLTSNMAKPAVPFGGKYRIIDFPLSNCVNSGFDTVGVLTQYRPLALNAYLGTGQHWDLDRNYGGVFVLPPYVTEGENGHWYSGTANAIWQNREFVDQYDPDYVLILSGDHIYKMDYAKMLSFHRKKNAAATIRFGIMNANVDGLIESFEEKPKEPKSNLASMGIYIFDWKKLRAYMEADDADPTSSNDFGKNIIPAMLNAGETMVAYPFEGYWRDVGTIQSLWEANMDLLGQKPVLDLDDDAWRIYTRNPVMPPHYISLSAQVTNSLVSEGAVVEGTVENSVIFSGAHIEKGATVKDSVIFPNATVGKSVDVEKAIVGENAIIGDFCVLGGPIRPGEKVNNKLTGDITLIGNDVTIPPRAYIAKGAVVNTENPHQPAKEA